MGPTLFVAQNAFLCFFKWGWFLYELTHTHTHIYIYIYIYIYIEREREKEREREVGSYKNHPKVKKTRECILSHKWCGPHILKKSLMICWHHHWIINGFFNMWGPHHLWFRMGSFVSLKSYMIHVQNHIWFTALTCNLSCEKFIHV